MSQSWYGPFIVSTPFSAMAFQITFLQPCQLLSVTYLEQIYVISPNSRVMSSGSVVFSREVLAKHPAFLRGVDASSNENPHAPIENRTTVTRTSSKCLVFWRKGVQILAARSSRPQKFARWVSNIRSPVEVDSYYNYNSHRVVSAYPLIHCPPIH